MGNMASTGYTGHLFEEEVLGVVECDWNGYMSFHESMDFVKSHQPWDPTDPNPRTANDMHSSVALALGLDDWSELRLYSAVHTPLDFYHGIDGFFEFRGRIVTVDVTINPHKNEYKADFIFHCGDDMEVFAHSVASRLGGEI